MNGPYATEADAAREELPRQVAALHAAGVVRSGDPDRIVHDTQLRAMHEACERAGLRLGDYDRRILRWLARWEPTTVQVIIGLILRAAAPKPPDIAKHLAAFGAGRCGWLAEDTWALHARAPRLDDLCAERGVWHVEVTTDRIMQVELCRGHLARVRSTPGFVSARPVDR